MKFFLKQHFVVEICHVSEWFWFSFTLKRQQPPLLLQINKKHKNVLSACDFIIVNIVVVVIIIIIIKLNVTFLIKWGLNQYAYLMSYVICFF